MRVVAGFSFFPLRPTIVPDALSWPNPGLCNMRSAIRNFSGWRKEFENFGGIKAINYWRVIDLQKKKEGYH